MSFLLSLLNQKHARAGADAPAGCVVRELSEADRAETTALLSTEPLRTVQLLGLIGDYGMSSPALRGRFYGYFENHSLAGVALLGHAMMIYTLPEAETAALEHFARKAVEIKARGHVIFGPRAQVEKFSEHLTRHGRVKRMESRHHWCIATSARLPLQSLQLRRANLDELESLAAAQAEMILETSGVDPRESDAEGFLRRTAERIERKRTWVRLADGKVIFKVEVVCETAETVYLEGVWTHPEWRNQGIAKSCMNELLHRLLQQKSSVCLAVSPEETPACRVYHQIGFAHLEDFLACYLNPLE
ncbi:MAG TPA: GNAT family N-acetyltransferase [Blastocatellia bacterium]|nr:GNAT family N-acetyltransferase [Blastocatellia bacterium]